MANDYFNHSANIIASGIRALAAQVNNIANEVATGLDKLPTELQLKRGLTRFAVDTGAADAYVVTLPYVPALVDGLEVSFRPINASTGASTINVNALGAKAIVLFDLTAIQANSIVANSMCTMRFSSVGDHFVLMTGAAAIQSVNNASTLALTNDVTDTTNFVVFANNPTGEQAIKTNAALTFNASTGALGASSLTLTGALNVNGAFTSIGIDDNCTAERVQVADSQISLGVTAVDYVIASSTNTQTLHLSGGSTFVLGANISLDGGAHASTGDMDFRNDANTWMLWDESVGDLEILTGIGAKTSALTISPGQLALFAGDIEVANAQPVIELNETDAAVDNKRVHIFQSGQTFDMRFITDAGVGGTGFLQATRIGNAVNQLTMTAASMIVAAPLAVTGAFTSLGIDDNATAERLQLADTICAFGAADTTIYTLQKPGNAGSLALSGGGGINSGANIVAYGSTHASLANDMLLRAAGNTWMKWDESAGSLTLSTGTGVKTTALTISAAQAVTVNGAFTSLGIDDNATAGRMILSDTELVLGRSATAGTMLIRSQNNNAFLNISAGSTDSAGAVIKMVGGSATNSNDMSFFAGTNAWMLWDESVGDLEILTGTGVKTTALTISAAGIDVTGDILMAEQAAATDPGAAHGKLWVKNDAPNRPYFTDDTDVDRKIVTADVTVSGHVRAGNTQLFLGRTALTILDVAADVTALTFETVGPTGSGATNIWAPMNNLPANATILLARLDIAVDPSGSSPSQVTVWAQDGDGVAAVLDSNIIAKFISDQDTGITGPSGMQVEVMIPLEIVNQDFKITWSSSFSDINDVSLHYRGFMTD